MHYSFIKCLLKESQQKSLIQPQFYDDPNVMFKHVIRQLIVNTSDLESAKKYLSDYINEIECLPWYKKMFYSTYECKQILNLLNKSTQENYKQNLMFFLQTLDTSANGFSIGMKSRKNK